MSGYWKHIELITLWQLVFHSRNHPGAFVSLIDAHVVCHAAAISSSHQIQLAEVLCSHPPLQNKSGYKVYVPSLGTVTEGSLEPQGVKVASSQKD